MLNKLKDKIECPNCKSMHNEDDFEPTFRYSSLIECPDCKDKIKSDNKAIIY